MGSPEISGGRGEACAPLQSGGLLLLPGGPWGQEPPTRPRHIPSPVLWAIWTYLFLCYEDLPCHRRPLEAEHPATVAALLPIIRLLSAESAHSFQGTGQDCAPPLPQPCHPSAPQALCLLSLRLSAQDREAISHIPHRHCYTRSGRGHGYCRPSISPSTAPGPQVRALATGRGCSLVVSPPHSPVSPRPIKGQF